MTDRLPSPRRVRRQRSPMATRRGAGRRDIPRRTHLRRPSCRRPDRARATRPRGRRRRPRRTHGSPPSVTTTSRAPIARNASAIAAGASASVSRRPSSVDASSTSTFGTMRPVQARASSSSAHNAGRWLGSYTTVPPRSCTAVAYARSARRPASCNTAMAMPLKHSTSTTDPSGRMSSASSTPRNGLALRSYVNDRSPVRIDGHAVPAELGTRHASEQRDVDALVPAEREQRLAVGPVPHGAREEHVELRRLASQGDGEVQRVAPEPLAGRSRWILPQLDERFADDQDARHGCAVVTSRDAARARSAIRSHASSRMSAAGHTQLPPTAKTCSIAR